MTSPKASVRPAIAADAESVQRIYADCVRSADWLPVAARNQTDFASVSLGETIHIATDNTGRVLGFVSIQKEDAFIHHLFVDAEAREGGVGRVLLASLASWLPTPWRLKCVRANEKALAFYAALGWREVGEGVADHGPYAILEWTADEA